MNALGLYPAYLQKLGCPLHHTFGVAEHHDPLIAFFVQNAEHGFHFGIPRHIDAVLDNVRLVLLVGPDGDLLGVALVDPGNVHHFAGNSSRKQSQVSAVGDLVQNTGHIVDKTHVQHTIRLIQHDGLHCVHLNGAALHMVAETSRRGHNNLRIALERVDLFTDGLTAVAADDFYPCQINGQIPQFVSDLQRQFPGRRQDHSLDRLAFRVNMFQNRDTESKRFSGARGSLCSHIPPFQHGRDSPGLDGCGYFISLFLDRTQNRLGQSQRIKAHALRQFHSFYSSIP